jgi:DNA-binding FadR family transcriptional regulator
MYGRRQPRLPKASDVLADRLRAQILGNQMRPGEPLRSEATLIAETGFSRGTVREALRLLESDGLIEIRRGPHGGIRVAEPDLSQVTRSLALLLTISGTTMRAFSEFRQLFRGAACVAARARRRRIVAQRFVGAVGRVPRGARGVQQQRDHPGGHRGVRAGADLARSGRAALRP